MAKRRQSRQRSGAGYYDYNLLAVIILLTAFGLVMLYSTSSYIAEVKTGKDMFYLKKQALYSGLSLILMIIVSLADYRILKKLAFWLYLAAMAAMAAVRSPLGVTYNGARRWLRIAGIQFQPSEIAKIAIITLVPLLICKMGRKYRGWKGLVPPFVVGASAAAFAYFLTENLSTAIIILMITLVIMFVAHPNTAGFLAAGAAFALAVCGLVIFLVNSASGGSFRVQRILVWLDPEAYADSGGYQIMQALYALGSGGFFGKGLGNSNQKLGPLPEAQNDMIFSIVCEELGVFGGILLIGLFVYLLYRLLFIARNAPDLYGSLMVTGIFGHVALQVILNICVVINLIPTTGVTLPFVSYGGTSALFLMMEMAIALSVSRRITLKDAAV